MSNISEIYEACKLKVEEFKDLLWQKFKSIFPANVQDTIDNFELKYQEYKKTSWCEIIETIVFVLVMVIVIRFFVCEIRWIPSGSMNPTLVEGDRILVERFSRFYTTPKRGDIMVFYPPSTELSRKPLPLLSRLTGIMCKDIAYIKRVVGLPGDKVEVKFEEDGSAYVYINDQKYEESYIKSPYDYTPCPSEEQLNEFWLMSDTTVKCGPFVVPEDSYFMMGDNRGNSMDSRYWGTLKRDRFIGRAVFVARFFRLPHLKSTNID